MPRLYRPPIPLEVKLRVALRQLDFGSAIEDILRMHRRGYGKLLAKVLDDLAKRLNCSVEDLRLDHDPALGLRPKERRGLSKRIFYTPDANDPAHLNYRPHGAQFDGSHDVKTRIRGEHGQFSDVVLIKRQRRRERREMLVEAAGKPVSALEAATGKKRDFVWPSRPMGKRPKGRKHKWQSRPLGGKKSPRRFGG